MTHCDSISGDSMSDIFRVKSFKVSVTSQAGRRGLERKNAPKVFLEGQELPLRQATGLRTNAI